MAQATQYRRIAGLSIDTVLYDFIEQEALPGTGISASRLWQSLADLVTEMTPRNRALLARRAELQEQIDQWHQTHDYRLEDYKRFLQQIAYLEPEGEDFAIATENVDAEIAITAAPQLVVPVNNARYALNAANARWGSLYDAIYGSDMLRDLHPRPAQAGFDPLRGQVVVDHVNQLLDRYLPLSHGSHAEANAYQVVDGQLRITTDEAGIALSDTDQFVAYIGSAEAPDAILLRHNGLHIELRFDRDHFLGRNSRSGLCDVVLEAAATVIQDCEDSVAAVDGEDKVEVYRNWLGLMKGDLSTQVNKGDRTITRRLATDREYTAVDGSPLRLKGRALMLVRNVGHLMSNPAVLDSEGEAVFEGILDALFTALIALHDLKGNALYRNSERGSVYIVKPKMHGPDEVSFACDLFSRVEEALEMPRNTLKIGLMDEEKRTTVNLKECIRAARERLIFINTGFLDRTGDEIHTAMLAGPVVRKAEMKSQAWIKAYEDWNVDIGLACGLSGRAQIGKGMWPMPDEMAAMVEQKAVHPQTGANCAWVPSPTAAVLHALHYHDTDVWATQQQVGRRKRASLDELLTLPIGDPREWRPQDIQQELDNNCQGILGYVVRWIDQGVGCSKVPDISDTGLMEDRATLRISSQHIANWLYHGVVSEEQVVATLRRMAEVVDRQNADDPAYICMAPDFQGHAFESALQLILRGREAPSGYTEPVLHRMRLMLKRGEPASPPTVLFA